MPVDVDEGFVIRKVKIKEYDYIIDIFSKNKGRLTLISKSSRKITSTKIGKLELMTKNKFAYTKSEKLGLLTEVEEQEVFDNLRESKAGRFLIFYISEVLNKYIIESDSLDQIYNTVMRSFIEANENINKVMIEIERICYEIINREQVEYKTICINCGVDIYSKNVLNFRNYMMCNDCLLDKQDNQAEKKEGSNKPIYQPIVIKQKFSLTNGLIENIIGQDIKSFNFLLYKQ